MEAWLIIGFCMIAVFVLRVIIDDLKR